MKPLGIYSATFRLVAQCLINVLYLLEIHVQLLETLHKFKGISAKTSYDNCHQRHLFILFLITIRLTQKQKKATHVLQGKSSVFYSESSCAVSSNRIAKRGLEARYSFWNFMFFIYGTRFVLHHIATNDCVHSTGRKRQRMCTRRGSTCGRIVSEISSEPKNFRCWVILR
jgi:hypothetical protein